MYSPEVFANTMLLPGPKSEVQSQVSLGWLDQTWVSEFNQVRITVIQLYVGRRFL